MAEPGRLMKSGGGRRIIGAGALGSVVVATSQGEEPAPLPRSAERERLAEAVAQHQAAASRLQQMRAALEKARSASLDKMIAVTAAEDALAEAEEAAPKRRVAQLLGEPDDGGPTVADAQRVLEAARNEHQLAREVIGVLEKEIAGADQHEAIALMRRDRALVAMLDADPAVDALISAFDDARARVATLADALKFLGLTRLPERHQTWQSTNRVLPPIEPLVPVWKAAIDALERGQVDTPLPTA